MNTRKRKNLQKDIRSLLDRASKIGTNIWRGYDIGFQYNWVVELQNKKRMYIEYTEEALTALVVSLEREDKLKQLGL
jgi:hypothetical protein